MTSLGWCGLSFKVKTEREGVPSHEGVIVKASGKGKGMDNETKLTMVYIRIDDGCLEKYISTYIKSSSSLNTLFYVYKSGRENGLQFLKINWAKKGLISIVANTPNNDKYKMMCQSLMFC